MTSENGWDTTTTRLQLTTALDDVLNPGKEGQAWILLWDMASIHSSQATLAAMKAKFPHIVLCFIPPHSTSYLQPCDVAVFRSFESCIQEQASATLARSILDGSFDDVVMNRAWRRQSSAEWRAGRRRLRAHCDNDFRGVVGESAALHAPDDLFAKHIAPEPAEADPRVWAMAEESDDDEDGTPPHADADEPELIDMPPAPASAPPMSNLSHCTWKTALDGVDADKRV